MAMIKCKECGSNVSNKAASCPHCGLTKPGARGYGIGSVIIISSLVIWSIADSQFNPPSSKYTEQEKIEQAKKDALDQKKYAVLTRATLIKKTMRNPDSFKVQSVILTESGSACFEFISQNGFGGMNNGAAVSWGFDGISMTDMNGFYENWKRECDGKSGKDITKYIDSNLR